MVIWPIAVLRDKRNAPSKELVEDVLDQIAVSICKRLRSSDASVSRVYSPDCEKLRWKGGVSPYCRCSSCVWQLLQPVPAEDSGLLGSFFRGGHCESRGTEVRSASMRMAMVDGRWSLL